MLVKVSHSSHIHTTRISTIVGLMPHSDLCPQDSYSTVTFMLYRPFCAQPYFFVLPTHCITLYLARIYDMGLIPEDAKIRTQMTRPPDSGYLCWLHLPVLEHVSPFQAGGLAAGTTSKSDNLCAWTASHPQGANAGVRSRDIRVGIDGAKGRLVELRDVDRGKQADLANLSYHAH